MKKQLTFCITLLMLHTITYSSDQPSNILTQLQNFMIHVEVAIAKAFDEEDDAISKETTSDTKQSHQQHHDTQLYVDFANGYIPIIYQEESKTSTKKIPTLSIEEIEQYRQQAAECRFQQLARKHGPKLYDKIKDRNFDIIEIEQSNTNLHIQAQCKNNET